MVSMVTSLRIEHHFQKGELCLPSFHLDILNLDMSIWKVSMRCSGNCINTHDRNTAGSGGLQGAVCAGATAGASTATWISQVWDTSFEKRRRHMKSCTQCCFAFVFHEHMKPQYQAFFGCFSCDFVASHLLVFSLFAICSMNRHILFLHAQVQH